jgi:hypothetical protein
MSKTLYNTTIATSVGLFLISLTQQAYCTTNLCRSSLDTFLIGIFGVFYGGAAVVWLANILLFSAWICIKRFPSLSFVLSLFALITSSSFLLQTRIVDNEAGHLNQIIKYGMGYWLWVVSSLALFVGHAISYFLGRKKSAKFPDT